MTCSVYHWSEPQIPTFVLLIWPHFRIMKVAVWLAIFTSVHVHFLAPVSSGKTLTQWTFFVKNIVTGLKKRAFVWSSYSHKFSGGLWKHVGLWMVICHANQSQIVSFCESKRFLVIFLVYKAICKACETKVPLLFRMLR